MPERRNKSDKRRINSYVDPKITEANRKMDQKFYESNEHLDHDLYNMGGNTPLLNENLTEEAENRQEQ